jgi:hypothetical protein
MADNGGPTRTLRVLALLLAGRQRGQEQRCRGRERSCYECSDHEILAAGGVAARGSMKTMAAMREGAKTAEVGD